MAEVLKHHLGVNIVSIVIGALFFAVAVAWIDTIRAVCAAVIDHHNNTDRYKTMKRRIYTAIIVTLICAIIMIAIYMRYKGLLDLADADANI